MQHYSWSEDPTPVGLQFMTHQVHIRAHLILAMAI